MSPSAGADRKMDVEEKKKINQNCFFRIAIDLLLWGAKVDLDGIFKASDSCKTICSDLFSNFREDIYSGYSPDQLIIRIRNRSHIFSPLKKKKPYYYYCKLFHICLCGCYRQTQTSMRWIL